MVEGYFDWAQVVPGRYPERGRLVGHGADLAQVKLLHRYAGKVILSFDPDAAGQGAAAKSSEMFVDRRVSGQRRHAAGRR